MRVCTSNLVGSYTQMHPFLGTNIISPTKALLKMIFPFPLVDMLVSGRDLPVRCWNPAPPCKLKAKACHTKRTVRPEVSSQDAAKESLNQHQWETGSKIFIYIYIYAIKIQKKHSPTTNQTDMGGFSPVYRPSFSTGKLKPPGGSPSFRIPRVRESWWFASTLIFLNQFLLELVMP